MIDSLLCCESFHSIQGEGPSVGKPSVFLRLSGCNLTCSGFGYGCDTRKILQSSKKKMTFEEILDDWERVDWISKLSRGDHLVITGGEPSIQKDSLVKFLDFLVEFIPNLYVEIETNATIFLEELSWRVNQINASPKLSCNGDPREKRYRPEVLRELQKTKKAFWKFVVTKVEDLEEIENDFLKPLRISPNFVWLMPEGGTRDALQAKREWVIELCKEKGMNYSGRLHIETWGERTGV